jgi:hypothetical protein
MTQKTAVFKRVSLTKERGAYITAFVHGGHAKGGVMPTIGDAIKRFNEITNLVDFFGMDQSILERATKIKEELVKAQFPSGMNHVSVAMGTPLNQEAAKAYNRLMLLQR